MLTLLTLIAFTLSSKGVGLVLFLNYFLSRAMSYVYNINTHHAFLDMLVPCLLGAP